MQAVANRGDGLVLVSLDEPDEQNLFDQSRGVIVNTRRGEVSEPRLMQAILARGYWTPFQGDPGPVLALASSALTAAGLVANWDEAKHPRHPPGSARGGEFASQSATLDDVGEHWGKESPGHVVFVDDWEYFRGPNGDVYRARRDHPFDTVTGYRTGARFEFPFWQLKQREEQGVYPFNQLPLEAAGFDESKIRRYPRGTKQRGREGGGRFAPKGTNEAEKESSEEAPKEKLVGSWLKAPAETPQDAYYKATRPREAVEIARGWLDENGFKDEAKGNAVQVVQAMQDHYPDGYEFFLSINDMHKEDFRRHYMKDGSYTPEREQVHNAIRAAYLKDAKLPPKGEQPEALFMAGGSGAGKSSILGHQTDGKWSGGTIKAPEGSVYVNPDDIKELLPDTQRLRSSDDDRWAALAHEESSDVAARLRKDAEQAGFPMVIDGTGDSAPGKFLGKIQDAEKAGYRTKVVFVDIPTDEAIRRAEERAERTGRKVSSEQIRAIHQNVTQRHLDWRDKVDNWEVWANDDEKQGGRRLIASRTDGGPIKVEDKKRYDQMLEKAK